MKFTDEDLEQIRKALLFSANHSLIKAHKEKSRKVLDAINARLEKKIPVVHYHFYTELCYDYELNGVTTHHVYQHPMAFSPCGYAAYEDPSKEDDRHPNPPSILTKTMLDVTCKKCRVWLHLEPLKRRTHPKISRVERNIILEL